MSVGGSIIPKSGGRNSSMGASQANQSSMAKKHILSAIPALDLIPLNWIKMPETRNIFNILSKCFGPQSDTAKVFSEINELATSTYI